MTKKKPQFYSLLSFMPEKRNKRINFFQVKNCLRSFFFVGRYSSKTFKFTSNLAYKFFMLRLNSQFWGFNSQCGCCCLSDWCVCVFLYFCFSCVKVLIISIDPNAVVPLYLIYGKFSFTLHLNLAVVVVVVIFVVIFVAFAWALSQSSINVN